MDSSVIEAIAFSTGVVETRVSSQLIGDHNSTVECPSDDSRVATEIYWCSYTLQSCQVGGATIGLEDLAMLGITLKVLTWAGPDPTPLFCLVFSCTIGDTAQITCGAVKHFIQISGRVNGGDSGTAAVYFWLILVGSVLVGSLGGLAVGYTCGWRRGSTGGGRVSGLVDRRSGQVYTTASSAHSNPMYDGTMTRTDSRFSPGHNPSVGGGGESYVIDETYFDAINSVAESNFYDMASSYHAPPYSHVQFGESGTIRHNRYESMGAMTVSTMTSEDAGIPELLRSTTQILPKSENRTITSKDSTLEDDTFFI